MSRHAKPIDLTLYMVGIKEWEPIVYSCKRVSSDYWRAHKLRTPEMFYRTSTIGVLGRDSRVVHLPIIVMIWRGGVQYLFNTNWFLRLCAQADISFIFCSTQASSLNWNFILLFKLSSQLNWSC